MFFDTRKRALVSGAALLAAAALPAAAVAQEPAGDYAKAEMMNRDGEQVGVVTVEQTPSGQLVLTAVFEGLPEGNYGFHIHETGSCSPDFAAAGGHFAPEDASHGVLAEGGPHAGDLPNLAVPQSGFKEVKHFVDGVTLSDGENALLDDDGAAVIVHRRTDDYESQPAGDAGARIVCGVLEAV